MTGAHLLARGAHLTDHPGDAKGAPPTIAKSIDARRDFLVTMLTGCGAKHAQE